MDIKSIYQRFSSQQMCYLANLLFFSIYTIEIIATSDLDLNIFGPSSFADTMNTLAQTYSQKRTLSLRQNGANSSNNRVSFHYYDFDHVNETEMLRSWNYNFVPISMSILEPRDDVTEISKLGKDSMKTL
uniref:Uncharacterized protein n=1 Tax=Romanomermis culicivorax TaxID=13658 RepID=A0A915J685_ROMCU